jgi:uncharacterized repeat protein (TIGR03837 family)
MPTPALLWDIFCRVIDNHGDLGVCWRLAADLAARGHRVRLWVDDASALQWMAPGALEGTWPNVTVHPWAQSHNGHFVRALEPAEVWVEGFGCEIAPEFIAASPYQISANGQKTPQNPVWINLEYLSAEAYVERAHGLPSPVMQGPGAGLTKHFFYPGFTHRTGGLLREPNWAQRQQAFAQSGVRRAWLQRMGVPCRGDGERLVSLFCYEPPALAALLAQLAADNCNTLLLVTAGRATAAVQAATQHIGLRAEGAENLRIHYLPPMPQADFDHLLWASDLNLVRGEDSLVRALWAGKAFAWQIYPQDDNAHHDKLNAFLDMVQAPACLRQFHLVWNGLSTAQHPAPMPWEQLPLWTQTALNLRERLTAMDDLTSQLVQFVQKKS